MSNLIREITITVERRQVAVLMPDGSERLGFFHRWSSTKDLAMVECPDGTMEYVNANAIRFLPIGNEVSPHKLEEVYRLNGILKG